MSFLFISHASTDKLGRVRPLVEALIAEGESVWIDCPGAGDGNLGFTQAYIDRHDIDYLQSGRSWSASIRAALRESGAVVGCLSRALLGNPTVLEQELLFADTANKLVTCIVDDLPFADLARSGRGLIDLRHHQSPRIDCGLLRDAVRLRTADGRLVPQLPAALHVEWEKVQGLIASANRVRREPRPLKRSDIDAAAPLLESIPVGPILRVDEIPFAIIQALGEKLGTADQIESAFTQASALINAAFPEGFTQQQILLRRGQLPPFGTLAPEVFWTHTMAAAGLKARRTVAAFLSSPIAKWALASAGAGDVADAFLKSLAARTLVGQKWSR